MNLGQENENQEFKQSLSQLDKGIKSLTAMLNRNQKGIVYFGVDDNGNVKGLLIGKKTLSDIRSRIKDLVEPQIIAEIENCKSTDGKQYVKVSAYGTDIPYSCDGRYYIRNVSSDESVSNLMLRKMLASGESDLIREITSENQELTFKQLSEILSNKKIHFKDSRLFYKNYGLINKDGKYNYMAYLLSDQNNTSIKVVSFSGLDKSNMSTRTEYGKQCLLKSISQIFEYFKSINVVNVKLNEGIRKEIPLFPFESLREAWVNACLHNSWNERIPPSIFMFDDRIEIVSYGGIPYGLSQDGFFKGTSLPVNKSLFTIFLISGFAEQSGHGIPIIVSECGKEAFSFEDNMIKVTIKFHYEPDSVLARKAREKAALKLTSNQHRVYNYLLENPSSNLQLAAKQLNLSLSGIKKIVSKLQSLDMLQRFGSKKSGQWIAKKTV